MFNDLPLKPLDPLFVFVQFALELLSVILIPIRFVFGFSMGFD